MNLPENIILLEPHVHKTVHAILNIPHKKVRDLRAMQSDLDVPYKEVVRKEAELQKEYFSNILKLQPEVALLHVNSLIGQIQRLRFEIKRRTLDVLDKSVS